MLNAMDTDRLCLWLAAPFTSLFLILAVCSPFLAKPQSSGISIPVLKLRTEPAKLSCDDRPIFVRLLQDGRTTINSHFIQQRDLGPRIGSIMEYRAERVVYLMPDSLISVDRFEQALAQLNASTEHLNIALLSGKLRQAITNRTRNECDLIWPPNAFK